MMIGHRYSAGRRLGGSFGLSSRLREAAALRPCNLSFGHLSQPFDSLRCMYHCLRVSSLGTPSDTVKYITLDDQTCSPDCPSTSAPAEAVREPDWMARPAISKDFLRHFVDKDAPMESFMGPVLGPYFGRAIKNLMVQHRVIQSTLNLDIKCEMHPSLTAPVTVEPLIASVNTADLNTISGSYRNKPGFVNGPSLHSVPGSEFVGQVSER